MPTGVSKEGKDGVTMANLQDLREHLQRLLPLLQGDWVSGRGRYEKSFASAIGATLQGTRYWDCIWRGIPLELKLGQSVAWLDLVRYSECLLERAPETDVPVVTLFMRYRGERITDVYAVRTENLLRALGLTAERAEDVLRIRNGLPRTLNAQAMLTHKDIREVAEFHVHGSDCSDEAS